MQSISKLGIDTLPLLLRATSPIAAASASASAALRKFSVSVFSTAAFRRFLLAAPIAAWLLPLSPRSTGRSTPVSCYHSRFSPDSITVKSYILIFVQVGT